MVIKNTNATPVAVQMASRSILLRPGDEEMVTAEEVQDEGLRDHLQVRSVSIVRPTTEEEEIGLKERLESPVTGDN